MQKALTSFRMASLQKSGCMVPPSLLTPSPLLIAAGEVFHAKKGILPCEALVHSSFEAFSSMAEDCKHAAEDMRMWPMEEACNPAGRLGLSEEELREGGVLAPPLPQHRISSQRQGKTRLEDWQVILSPAILRSMLVRDIRLEKRCCTVDEVDAKQVVAFVVNWGGKRGHIWR